LKQAEKEGVERLYILGDMVGYYYYPELVWDMISKWPFEMIRGNHEDILSGILSGTVASSEVKEKYGSGHNMAIEKLSANVIQTITNAPISLDITIDSMNIGL